MDWFFSRELALRERAMAVLGLDPAAQDGPPERSRVQYAYHCAMLRHHPDRNPGDSGAHARAALCNEACALLMGRPVTPSLLRDDALAQSVMDDPVTPLDAVPSYEEWLHEQFYDVDNRSIWSV
jgi:hypothetical protein